MWWPVKRTLLKSSVELVGCSIFVAKPRMQGLLSGGGMERFTVAQAHNPSRGEAGYKSIETLTNSAGWLSFTNGGARYRSATSIEVYQMSESPQELEGPD